jgi:hypothetical protein
MSVFVWYCGGVDEMRGGPSIVDDIIICSECGRLAPDQNGCRWVLESQSVDWCALFLKYGGHARDCVRALPQGQADRELRLRLRAGIAESTGGA